MLYAAKLPRKLWSVAVKTMAYLHNRSPMLANQGCTPIEVITGEKPNLAHLRIFGTPISVAVQKERGQNGTHTHEWCIWLDTNHMSRGTWYGIQV
jgi:hypothetical protein